MNTTALCVELLPTDEWRERNVPAWRDDVQRGSAVEQQAMTLVQGALCLPSRDHLAAVAPDMWDAGVLLLESSDLTLQRQGMLLVLHVLTMSPNPGQASSQRLLGDLSPSHGAIG